MVTIAAITNVAVALAILGAFALVAINLHHMAALEAQSAVITCELDEGADPADVEAALLLDMRVKGTKFVTRDQALENLAKKWDFDLNVLKAMGNPLPDTILVYVSDPEEIGAVADAAGKVEASGGLVSRTDYREDPDRRAWGEDLGSGGGRDTHPCHTDRDQHHDPVDDLRSPA